MTTTQPSGDRDFSFPGTPYDVQRVLMDAIYTCIENGHIGLFESPTGTGKTLSIICSSLTWLSENRFAVQTSPDQQEPNELDWVLEQTRTRKQRLAGDELHRRKSAYWKRVSDVSQQSTARKRRGSKCQSLRLGSGQPEEESILSSDEEDGRDSTRLRTQRTVKSARIIFATRTHSQLTQFLEELRKTCFSPPTFQTASTMFQARFEQSHDAQFKLPLCVMPFGSRKQFCINEEVRALESAAAISERCRELTEAPEETSASQKRKRSRNRCVYKNADAEAALRDKALVEMHSIEELTQSGKEMGACPYFASRGALESGDVDVIGVPYSAVLHAPTRESLGLEIDENTVVVFDEAHNIVNTVCELHSSVLTRSALVQTREALKAYKERYESRFSGSNLFSLRQLIALCEGLLCMLPARNDENGRQKLAKPRVVHPAQLLYDAGVDNINLFVLVSFMKDSRLCKKLRGFLDSESNGNRKSKDDSDGSREKKVREGRRGKQSIAAFENFVRSIADCAVHGRVGVYPYKRSGVNWKDAGEETGEELVSVDCVARFKYFVTEPGELFTANVGQARAVLMLGGTLSPRSGIKTGLLGGMEKRIVELECTHVVPRDHVVTQICGSGPTGGTLEFTYQRRHNSETADELGRAIEHVCGVVPGGVVVFFSSYELLGRICERWKSSEAYAKIEQRKALFVETRGDNNVFNDYRKAIEEGGSGGAVLLAVMGGKLSEGINFSDDLGRAVVMVGMPFANAMQVETAEMLKRFDTSAARSEFLENECMTVVNQCIGRAVRHKKDYAAILLMDARYGRSRVVHKLPRFVRSGLREASQFAHSVHHLTHFFARFKRQQPQPQPQPLSQ